MEDRSLASSANCFVVKTNTLTRGENEGARKLNLFDSISHLDSFLMFFSFA